MPRKAVPEGHFQALDHAANWVRFADTKATVLTAAFGVVTTMLAANVPSIARAASADASWLGPLLAVATGAFFYTLWWLIHALTPRRGTEMP